MKDLFGNIILDANDVADILIQNSVRELKINSAPNTKQGFSLCVGDGIVRENDKGYHNIKGIYAIFLDNQCLVVGKSDKSIGMRLSRFVKENWNKSRRDENYPAAKKYRSMYGGDLDFLTVKIYPCDPKDFSASITLRDVERAMHKKLKPLLNREYR